MAAAARASPSDDAPLLVLADQLSEGGSTHGEFIHLQCRRARLQPNHPDLAALTAREQALLAADGSKWLGPAWHPLIEFEFRRGVPTGRFGHAGIFLSELAGEGTRSPSRQALRVYPYGWAFTVSVVANPGIERDLATWFDDRHPATGRGALTAQWRADGLALSFEAKSSAGTVHSTGLLRDGCFECETHSLINGHRGTSRFVLTPAPCDTRPRFAAPSEAEWDGQHDGHW